MGLAHICSGMYANQGQLTITNLSTTQMAIDYLSSRSTNGFFLMVEGARRQLSVKYWTLTRR